MKWLNWTAVFIGTAAGILDLALGDYAWAFFNMCLALINLLCVFAYEWDKKNPPVKREGRSDYVSTD